MISKASDWLAYRIFLRSAGVAHDAVQAQKPEAVAGALSPEDMDRQLMWERIREANHLQLLVNTAFWLRRGPSAASKARRFAQLQSTGLTLNEPMLNDPYAEYPMKDVPFWLLNNYTFPGHPSRYTDEEVRALHAKADADSRYKRSDAVGVELEMA